MIHTFLCPENSDRKMPKPRWILEISKRELESSYQGFDLENPYRNGPEGILVLPVQPNRGYSPVWVDTNDITDMDAYIRQTTEEYHEQARQEEKIKEYIASLFREEEIDWSLESDRKSDRDGENEWREWLDRGPGKILLSLPLPPSIFIDLAHYGDYVFECGDVFVFEPLDISELTDAQALRLLLLLEIDIVEKGQATLYRILRKRCGVPYDCCDESSLKLETIQQLVQRLWTDAPTS